MLNLRVRGLAVVVVVGLVGLDIGLSPVAGAADPPKRHDGSAQTLATEKGAKGDPGPLESTPRDFGAEFPITDRSTEKVAGEDGGPISLAGTRDLKRVREVVDERTEATETFELEDGSFVTDVSLVPKWYRDPKGEWAKVDNRIVADPERKGRLRNEGAVWPSTPHWIPRRTS